MYAAACAVESDPLGAKPPPRFPVQRRTSRSRLSSSARLAVESVNFSSVCVSRERSPESLAA